MNIICKLTEEDNFVIDADYTEHNINRSDIFTYTFWNNDSVKKFLNLPSFFLQ